MSDQAKQKIPYETWQTVYKVDGKIIMGGGYDTLHAARCAACPDCIAIVKVNGEFYLGENLETRLHSDGVDQYRWKDATVLDLGKVARFFNKYDDNYSYGVLMEVGTEWMQDVAGAYYQKTFYASNLQSNIFDFCQVQHLQEQEKNT